MDHVINKEIAIGLLGDRAEMGGVNNHINIIVKEYIYKCRHRAVIPMLEGTIEMVHGKYNIWING